METLVSIAWLAGGLVVVVVGAEMFFKGLLASAARLGVSSFALTVVVSGFELENLAAGIGANLNNLPDAAAGTVFGGTTFLALGVAGLAAVFAPMSADVPRGTLLWTLAGPTVLLLSLLDGSISRLDGGLLLAWFVIVLVGLVRSNRKGIEIEERRPRRHPLLRLVGGLALLSVGGEVLGRGIREVVARLGISEALLGNTVVAASVEAEEAVRVAVPSREGRGDIGFGNIAGTIAHFSLFNAGVIALVKPLELDRVSVLLHAPAAVASTLLLCVLIAVFGRIGRRLGSLLLAAYAAYIAAAIAIALR